SSDSRNAASGPLFTPQCLLPTHRTMSRGGSSFTRAFFWPLQRLCSQTLLQAGFSYPPPGPSLFATALGKLRAKRVVARRPVRIWLVRSVCRIHDAIASHAAVVTSRTSLINFRFSNHLGVTLWPTVDADTAKTSTPAISLSRFPPCKLRRK